MSKNPLKKRTVFISKADQGSEIGKLIDPFWFAEDATFPVRQNISLEPLASGQKAFAEIHSAIKNAKKSIHIATWFFEPGMRLVRKKGVYEGPDDPEDQLGEILLKKANERVKVRLLLWDNKWIHGAARAIDLITTEWEKLNDKEKEKTLPNYFYDIFWLLAAEHNELKNINIARATFKTYSHDYENKELFLAFQKEFGRPRDIISPGKTPIVDTSNRYFDFKIEIIKNIISAKIELNSDLFDLDNYLFSHHQKTVTIDNEIGFVMGMNFRRGDWDTAEHRYDEPLRENERPRHDISAKIVGDCVQDVEYNFIERWNTVPGVKKITPLPPIKKTKIAQFNKIKNAQIIRTVDSKESSILEMYKNAISNAHLYIYIENQYFRSPEIAQEIAKAIVERKKTNKDLQVLIAIEPDESYFSPSRVYLSECFQILKPFFPNQVPIYKLMVDKFQYQKYFDILNWSTKYKGKASYKVINIHSKLMIIDDYFMTIGSANINKRSWNADSEINIAIIDPDKAKNLRIKLWSAHLGVSANSVTDVKKAVDLWKKTAINNIDKVENSRPIQGRVHPLKDPGRFLLLPEIFVYNEGETENTPEFFNV